MFAKKPEERIGFALDVAKELSRKGEYRKVVKLCDFIAMQLVDTGMGVLSSGLPANVLEVFDTKTAALCGLEDELVDQAEKAITASDARTMETLYEQITYTRHRKLWAYSDKLQRGEDAVARLGRAKAYLDLGRFDEARQDIEAAKAPRTQKPISVKVSK